MAPEKRTAPEALSGASKKRAKMRQQRVIPVEGHSARLGGSAERGNNTLPPTLEVEKFAMSRSFEITAMQRAMKSAKEAGTQRAFQSLPRHLRRRAASHNVKKLPIKLRAKALFETPKDSAKPKKKTRKLVGRKRRLTAKSSRTALLLRRQLSKIWLETHIWHAKRMHMTEIWGHRLAEKPTEKAFRSSYRASYHGALIHDASYYQYIELSGGRQQFVNAFSRVLDSADPSPFGPRYVNGSRELKTNIYTVDTFPEGLIGPVTFICQETRGHAYSTENYSTLLVRVHPSIGSKVLHALTQVLSHEQHIKIIPLKKAFLTFEITGKRATEVVKAVLNPVVQGNLETKKAWEKLSSTAGPGSVPNGMIFGMVVHDPRLSFPPKLDKSNPQINASDLLQPSLRIASNPSFWDPLERNTCRKPSFKKIDLDARRSKLLIPGTKLTPTAADDKIPILLSQNTISSPTDSSNSDEMSGWILTIPSGWGMAFWTSLVFSETRVGGLRERSQQYFEAGVPRFPEDFPGTEAFKEYEERRQASDQVEFERKPPAKRPNYRVLNSPDPFLCNFDSILGKWGNPMAFSWATRTDGKKLPVREVSPWLVPREILDTYVKRMKGEKVVTTDITSNLAAELLGDKQNYDLLGSGSNALQVFLRFCGALVRVRITPIDRGSPEELGYIYYLSSSGSLDGQYQEVYDSLKKSSSRTQNKCSLADGESNQDWLNNGDVPATGSIMGRITTGNYSLARGKGYAVGAIPFINYVIMVERDMRVLNSMNASGKGYKKKLDHPMLALVRNRDGEVYRPVMLSRM